MLMKIIIKNALKEYLHKASKGIKTHSNWIAPNEEYEKAAIEFAHKIIDNKKAYAICIIELLENGNKKSIGPIGFKIHVPGNTRYLQGTERWDLSLVDPTTGGRWI